MSCKASRGIAHWRWSLFGGLALVLSVPGSLDRLLDAGAALKDDAAEGRGPRTVNGEQAPRTATEARAESLWLLDADDDGFPDELELIFGTDPNRADTDRDGACDSYEFTLDTNPRDRLSVPRVGPSVRLHAVEREDAIRIHVGIFPADLHLVDGFEVHLGSDRFDQGLAVQRYRPFNFTPLLPACTTGLAMGSELGLDVLTLCFDLSPLMIEQFGPLTIAVSASIAGQVHAHQLQLSALPGGERVMASQILGNVGQQMSAALSYRVLPLNATYSGGQDDPEYCELSLGPGTPIGMAGRRFEILDAGCEPAGLTLCVQEECQDLVGAEILEVDRGYLQDRLD